MVVSDRHCHLDGGNRPKSIEVEVIAATIRRWVRCKDEISPPSLATRPDDGDLTENISCRYPSESHELQGRVVPTNWSYAVSRGPRIRPLDGLQTMRPLWVTSRGVVSVGRTGTATSSAASKKGPRQTKEA